MNKKQESHRKRINLSTVSGAYNWLGNSYNGYGTIRQLILVVLRKCDGTTNGSGTDWIRHVLCYLLVMRTGLLPNSMTKHHKNNEVPTLDNLLRMTKENGRLFVSGSFGWRHLSLERCSLRQTNFMRTDCFLKTRSACGLGTIRFLNWDGAGVDWYTYINHKVNKFIVFSLKNYTLNMWNSIRISNIVVYT